MEGKKTILIVEDDNTLQNIYATKFLSEGFHVLQARTGQQCLSIVRDTVPNIILLDIMLPEGMNGFDIFEQLKTDQRLKNIPVIMFTNLDSEKETAIKMGAADYILKANASIDVIVGKVKSHIPS